MVFQRKNNKYRNKKVTFQNMVFDSKLELEHYLLLKNDSNVSHLKRQVKIQLGNSKRFYIADFMFFDKKMKSIVIFDSKGIETKEFTLKRDWLLDTYKDFTFITKFRKESKTYQGAGQKSIKSLFNSLKAKKNFNA